MVQKTKLKNIVTFGFENKESILEYIKDKQNILVAVNAEKILKNETRLHDIINNNIGYADGIGAVLALRQKGIPANKIAGAELWLDIIKKFEKEKTFFLLGSSSEVIERTVKKLKQEFPSINILFYRDGFLKDGEKEKLVHELQEKKPDVVFIAQGSPRQEYLMDELIKVHPALYMGLGGSFDVYCGLKKRAPKLFIDYGLEWFYRLIKEPTRIGRQLILVRFIVLLAFKKI